MASDTERSAQDWFRFMVDMGLAPGLRDLGFFGAGRRYRMEVGQHWAEVVLTQSRARQAGSVRFTLELGIVSRNEWTEQLRVRPYSPRVAAKGMVTGWQASIGELVLVSGHPIGELWWELRIGQPFDSLAGDVLTTVREFGLPAVCARIHAAG